MATKVDPDDFFYPALEHVADTATSLVAPTPTCTKNRIGHVYGTGDGFLTIVMSRVSGLGETGHAAEIYGDPAITGIAFATRETNTPVLAIAKKLFKPENSFAECLNGRMRDPASECWIPARNGNSFHNRVKS